MGSPRFATDGWGTNWAKTKKFITAFMLEVGMSKYPV